MKQVRFGIGVCLIGLLGCSLTPSDSTKIGASGDGLSLAADGAVRLDKWPTDWSAHLGQTVSFSGWAHELKTGHIVMAGPDGNESLNYIYTEWADKSGQEPERLTRVRVTGTVVRRGDLPVFLRQPPPPGPGGNVIGLDGIPADTPEEVERLRWRFILTNATWKAELGPIF